jgi:hypothetical protein
MWQCMPTGLSHTLLGVPLLPQDAIIGARPNHIVSKSDRSNCMIGCIEYLSESMHHSRTWQALAPSTSDYHSIKQHWE